MTRRVNIALSILFCTWATTSQAGPMRTVFPWDNGLQRYLATPVAEGMERGLCISPCFSGGLIRYVAEYIANSPVIVQKLSPVFLPRVFLYPYPPVKPIHAPELPHTNSPEGPIVSPLLLTVESPTSEIPVPATVHLIGFGLASLIWSRRKRT